MPTRKASLPAAAPGRKVYRWDYVPADRARIEASAVSYLDYGHYLAVSTFTDFKQFAQAYQARAKVGTTDADIHHFGDGLFAVAAPQAAVDAADQFGHLVEYPVHLRDQVDDRQRRFRMRPDVPRHDADPIPQSGRSRAVHRP